MSEFDQAAWRRGQAQAMAADRRLAAKKAALDKKTSGGGGFSRSLKTFKKTAVARATRGQGSWTKAGKAVSFLFKKHEGAEKGDSYAEAAKNSELICSSMLGKNAAERLAEWRIDCARHPNVAPGRLIVHCSISRPEGHPLTNAEWSRYIAAFLDGIGAHGVNYIATLHPEKNQHAHLIYSRALPDSGGVLSDSNDYWKGRAAALEAGHKLGLLVDGPVNNDAERPVAATSDRQVNAQRRAQRRGTPAGHIDPAVIARVLARASTPDQFAAGLEAEHIRVKSAEKNGNVTGVLFQKSGADEWLAGSSISREFSLPKIRQALLKNEQEIAIQQRQRQALDHQRQAQQEQEQTQYPRERF